MQEAGDAALQLDDPSEYIDYIKPFQNMRKDKVSIVDIFNAFFYTSSKCCRIEEVQYCHEKGEMVKLSVV